MIPGICTCNPTGFGFAPCAVHLPDFVLRNIDAGAGGQVNEREAKTAAYQKKLQATVDQLARDRETIATQAINTFGELLLPHVPAPYRAILQELWTQFAPVAVERVTMQAASVTVVDERGAGSTVDLVEELG